MRPMSKRLMPTDAKPSQRQPRWRPHFQSIVSFSVACEVVSTVSHAASTLEPRSISQTSLSNSLTHHSLGRQGGCKEMCASLVATKMQRAGPQAPTGTATAHCSMECAAVTLAAERSLRSRGRSPSSCNRICTLFMPQLLRGKQERRNARPFGSRRFWQEVEK
jgi:hypothetical protein